MKTQILIFILILSSLFGYLEWSGDSSAFLYEVELEFFLKIFKNPTSVLHPFTILPIFGQILLLISSFQKKPNKLITLAGISGIGILLIFMFIIGLFSGNLKILISTIPFLFFASITLWTLFKVN